MEPRFSIAIINHSFQINYFSRRWELFAEAHPNVDVTLVAPREYEWYSDKKYTYNGGVKRTAQEIEKGNFHRRLINMSKTGWESDDYKPLFDEIKPNVVYLIGTGVSALYQLLKLRDKYYPQMKIINFSMRGPAQNLRIDIKNCDLLHKIWRLIQYFKEKKRLKYYNKHLDAVFCHYPDAVDCYRNEGYKGPIYMQTQVGVNPEWFHPDENARKEIRQKYNISDDTYLFGSASRFSPSKGLLDIVNALPLEGDWKFLMMGTGSEDEVNNLKLLINARGLEEKVILPGMIDWYEIAKYWNAVDCAVHVPRTTPEWVETFSLAAVQPQATKKPVIGNTSGSVPYQIGFKEMIVEEGEIEALHDKIEWVLNHKKEAADFGKQMYNRTINSFSIHHLNDMFYDTLVEDVLCGKYDIRKIDMANYTPKAHE
jgi:glycosyltransferase involved in cell wall biosynthesis